MFELPLAEEQQDCFLDEKTQSKEIAETYGHDSIVFNYGHVSKELRWAIMAVSDIWLITSLRQGYTLVKHIVSSCSR